MCTSVNVAQRMQGANFMQNFPSHVIYITIPESLRPGMCCSGQGRKLADVETT